MLAHRTLPKIRGGASAAPRPSPLLHLLVLPAVLLGLVLSQAYGISSRTLIAPTGAAAGDRLGYSVATAGDFNGDGYLDVIAGAYMNDAGGSNAGRAYIYFGGPGADAVADVVLTGEAAGDYFGFSVGPAGDVNGDGYDDVIVGAHLNDAAGTSAGRAYVYFGGPAPDAYADIVLTGEAGGDYFGYSVGAAGDVNGDGYSDVVVGGYLNDAGGVNAGRAYLYYGGPSMDTTADLVLTGAAASDEFGISVATAGDVNGDGYDDLIVGAIGADAGGSEAGRAYVYYGGGTPDAVADLTFTGAAASDHLGYSVDTAGDFNGDGYADVIVGADENDAGGGDAGRAYLYFGGPSADGTADLIITGAATSDYLGFSVGAAGDVNGDGYADVIVGAPGNDAGGSSAGRAYIYFGGSSVDAVADIVFTGAAPGDNFGVCVAGAGDVNGDGFADVIAGAYTNDAGGTDAGRAYVNLLYPYQVLRPAAGEQWVAGQPATIRWAGHDIADIALSTDGGLGWVTLVRSVGGRDENEYTLGAPGQGTTQAKLRIAYTGVSVSHANSSLSDGMFRIVLPETAPEAATRLDLAPAGSAAHDYFGGSAATAGDFNGDGFADVIVGADGNDAGGLSAGQAYVFYGGPGRDDLPDLILTGAAAGDAFGCSVGTAGDVNGDGFADVIVGAERNDANGTDAGRAYVYFGGAAPDNVPDIILSGNYAGDFFGSSVGAAGDVNGDGYADMIVGAPRSDAGGTDAGRAYVFYGGPAPDSTPDLIVTGFNSADYFGCSVAGGGDVNGDGFADIIVGAYRNDAGGGEAGRAYVYHGGRAPDATPDLILTGAPSDYFGSSVGSAGDFNGDGFSDLVVGAYHNSASGDDAGRVYVYYGGPGADATADLVLTAVAAGDEFGYPAATAGDVNGDGFSDLIVGANGQDAGGANAGRAYIYFGGPAPDAIADIVLTGAGTEDYFGISVATAGDVDGDGFDDVIIGADLADLGGIQTGRAYVYGCGRYFVLAPTGGETWPVGAVRSVSWLGSEPADLWLSVDGGSSYSLLEENMGGQPSNSVPIRVPHQPTRFARVKVTPHDPLVNGEAKSDSLFTIEASIDLLLFKAEPAPEGGVVVSWKTDPGPEELGGYRLERSALDREDWRVLAALGRETSYRDLSGGSGMRYRLIGINGLGEELLLGEAGLAAQAALTARPLPYHGGELAVSFATPGGREGGRSSAEVSVYGLDGRRVRTLARGSYGPGIQTTTWDGLDEAGRPAAGGVYFLRSTCAGRRAEIKLVVLR